MEAQLRRELTAVEGYLELGMHALAWDALVKIDDRYHDAVPFLRIRADVCRAMEKWDIVAEVTRQLAKHEPGNVQHAVKMAEAVREIEGAQAAGDLLDAAKEKYPPNGVLLYNLACYRATSGRIDEARSLLSEALALDASLRLHSLQDPDLKRALSGHSDLASG